eukprot:TRINITY_DN366_c0_g2_i1.p1 TRINITY_DN366_c0_g2~~TRINITY_DN366_c0_g2_i1.p1  ORF type:complete len:185 (-),score=29.30 TRINITY_DN366_c0_g2_i1:38-592(-)
MNNENENDEDMIFDWNKETAGSEIMIKNSKHLETTRSTWYRSYVTATNIFNENTGIYKWSIIIKNLSKSHRIINTIAGVVSDIDKISHENFLITRSFIYGWQSSGTCYIPNHKRVDVLIPGQDPIIMILTLDTNKNTISTDFIDASGSMFYKSDIIQNIRFPTYPIIYIVEHNEVEILYFKKIG